MHVVYIDYLQYLNIYYLDYLVRKQRFRFSKFCQPKKQSSKPGFFVSEHQNRNQVRKLRNRQTVVIAPDIGRWSVVVQLYNSLVPTYLLKKLSIYKT